MRPFWTVSGLILAAATAAHAGPALWKKSEPLSRVPAFSFSTTPHFAVRNRDDSPALILGRSLVHPNDFGASIVPSVTFGPFRASLGGHLQADGYDADAGRSWGSSERHGGGPGPELDVETNSVWGFHVGGSIDTRHAKLTFTLPTQ